MNESDICFEETCWQYDNEIARELSQKSLTIHLLSLGVPLGISTACRGLTLTPTGGAKVDLPVDGARFAAAESTPFRPN